jgi:hypothetical protein
LRVVSRGLPKPWSDQAPHSPFAAGFNSSQSGTKLPLLGSPTPNSVSFHVRFVVSENWFAGFAGDTRMMSG